MSDLGRTGYDLEQSLRKIAERLVMDADELSEAADMIEKLYSPVSSKATAEIAKRKAIAWLDKVASQGLEP